MAAEELCFLSELMRMLPGRLCCWHPHLETHPTTQVWLPRVSDKTCDYHVTKSLSKKQMKALESIIHVKR